MPMRVRQFDRFTIKPEIRRWHTSRKGTPRAADTGLQALSRLLAFGMAEGKLASNQCEGIPHLHKSNRADVIWTPDQVERFDSPRLQRDGLCGPLSGSHRPSAGRSPQALMEPRPHGWELHRTEDHKESGQADSPDPPIPRAAHSADNYTQTSYSCSDQLEKASVDRRRVWFVLVEDDAGCRIGRERVAFPRLPGDGSHQLLSGRNGRTERLRKPWGGQRSGSSASLIGMLNGTKSCGIGSAEWNGPNATSQNSHSESPPKRWAFPLVENVKENRFCKTIYKTVLHIRAKYWSG
jgi:hypothetical protein